MPDRRLQTALVLVLALTVTAAERAPGVRVDAAVARADAALAHYGAPADSCPLCHLPASMPIVHLRDADIDSLGASLAIANELELARVDSLYRSGVFGAASDANARRKAHLFARLATRNAYAYLAALATDSTRVREADEHALARAFATFSDPGLYPITRLRRARMGLGALCLSYDLRRDLDTLVTLGEKCGRVRVRDVDVHGCLRRMLSMMLPSGLDSNVEVLMPEHYFCRLDRLKEPGPPGPYEAVLLDDIHGLVLRKWGLHEPRAIMFWTTPRAAALDSLPAEP